MLLLLYNVDFSLFSFDLLVLSVRSPHVALQCPQVQIHHHYAGLWPGHHLCPQLSASSTCAQVSPLC